MERSPQGQAIVLGVILVLVGIAYLAVEFVPERFLRIDIAHYGWPLFVIVPGLVLIGVGGTIEEVSGLCVPGAIVTMVGLVLLFQNFFDLFATWSYTWALVAPGGIGLGMWLQGLVSDSAALRGAGARNAPRRLHHLPARRRLLRGHRARQRPQLRLPRPHPVPPADHRRGHRRARPAVHAGRRPLNRAGPASGRCFVATPQKYARVLVAISLPEENE